MDEWIDGLMDGWKGESKQGTPYQEYNNNNIQRKINTSPTVNANKKLLIIVQLAVLESSSSDTKYSSDSDSPQFAIQLQTVQTTTQFHLPTHYLKKRICHTITYILMPGIYLHSCFHLLKTLRLLLMSLHSSYKNTPMFPSYCFKLYPPWVFHDTRHRGTEGGGPDQAKLILYYQNRI